MYFIGHVNSVVTIEDYLTKMSITECRLIFGLAMQGYWGDSDQEEPSPLDFIEWNKWYGWRE